MALKTPLLNAERYGAGEEHRVSPHAEVHVNSLDGTPIYIYCDCEIGATHDYQTWLELPENVRMLTRAEKYRELAIGSVDGRS